MSHAISNHLLTISSACNTITHQQKIILSADSTQQIKNCRNYLIEKIKQPGWTVYGINTGFGHLCNTKIPNAEMNQLQRNLLLSHACGVGEEVPKEIVKLMLLLKVQSLSYGHSGVQLATVQRLIDFFNLDIIPVIYQVGSLGASGDLAPLSHLALPLIGEGEVYYQGQKMPAAQTLKIADLAPLSLEAKEGLALINGTQFMSAYGTWILHQAEKLADFADLIATVSLEAFNAHEAPFYEGLHQIRKQEGQLKVAARIRKYRAGTEWNQLVKTHVQDPYSFRCIPQVHGATDDAIQYVTSIFEREINAVTDNPNIFPEEDLILSGGNFHGQPLAIPLDYLTIALAELGNISERRTYKLVGGYHDLPSSLIDSAGLNSGLMIPQYATAALVSQNKQYCMPASADSITSSKGQEDHVSMGANAATKCYKVFENLQQILAIELLTAMQALDFRKQLAGNLKCAPKVDELHQAFRQKVSFMQADRYLYQDMQAALQFLKQQIQ